MDEIIYRDADMIVAESAHKVKQFMNPQVGVIQDGEPYEWYIVPRRHIRDINNLRPRIDPKTKQKITNPDNQLADI